MYDYIELCVEINNLRRNDNESLEYFALIFEQMYHSFPLSDKSSRSDKIEWIIYDLANFENQKKSIYEGPQSSCS